MLKPILILIIAMSSIQFGASIAKKIFPMFGASGSTSLRLLFASIILAIFFRPWQRELNAKQLGRCAAYGVSLGLMNLLFYYSLERIPLGIAVSLEFAGPLAIAILTSKKRLDFVWAALAVAGIWLFFPKTGSLSSLDPIGMAFALGAGLCWAFYIILGKRVTIVLDAPMATTMGMLFATLVVLPFGIAEHGTRLLNYAHWHYAVLVALLSSAIPYFLEMVSLKNLPTRTFGVLMSLEPVIATLMGLFFLDENITGIHLLAMAMIITSSVGSTLTNTTKS